LDDAQPNCLPFDDVNSVQMLRHVSDNPGHCSRSNLAYFPYEVTSFSSTLAPTVHVLARSAYPYRFHCLVTLL